MKIFILRTSTENEILVRAENEIQARSLAAESRVNAEDPEWWTDAFI